MAYINIYLNTGTQNTGSCWTAPSYWAASTAYTAEWGQGVKPTVANGHHYLCTSAGTSGSSDPFSATDKNWDVINDGTMQWTCFDPFTNPTIITGKPFGHGFHGSLWYLYYVCRNDVDHIVDYIDSTYLVGSTYNVDSLSCQHEVAAVRYRIYGTGLTNGYDYTVKETWKDAAGNTIFYNDYILTWDSSNTYFQTGGWNGWTPCWWWAYGSEYDGDVEITEGSSTGTTYTMTVEVYYGTTQICYSTKTFYVKNLHHTVIYWNHIQDYTGAEVGGDFGMKASKYVHDLGTDTWITAWYRQKNLDYNASIKVDGFDGTVNLQAYRSGHVKQTRSCTGVVDKNSGNGPYDFTGADYLQASVEGIVHNADAQLLSNVNVWGSRWPHYGAKTMSNGKYALPCHIGGTYQIRASKNNHIGETQPTTVVQTGDHPTARALRDFTGAYVLERRTDYPQGEYAHVDSLAVDNQSVIIPDDPVTGAGTLLHPDSVGASVVKVKTRKWGTGAAQSTTSTGTSNGGKGHGSGGLDYDGNMGDAEYWSEEP